MRQNGEHNVIDFVYVESRQLLYVGSHQHFHNLTDMRRKPSACITLCMGMVPKVYHPPPVKGTTKNLSPT
jgi:hypothetical protein